MRRTLAVALASMLGAGCAVGPPPEHATDVRPAPTSHPSTTVNASADPSAGAPSTEGLVLRAVEGFVTSTVTVNDPPTPDHPDLARYRTGAVLDNAVVAVRQNLALGIAYRRDARGPSRQRTTVVGLHDDEATVRNCVVDDVRQIAVADGRVLNDSVATKLFETTLRRIDGEWKVAANALVERWEGVAGCAVS